MNSRIGTVFFVFLVLTWALPARAQEVVTLATGPGVTQSYFLASLPKNPHGFFGKESETVEQIVNWMLKKPFRQDVI